MKTEPLILFKVLLLSFGLGVALGVGNDLLGFLGGVFSHIRRTPHTSKKTLQTVLRCLQDLLFCFTAGFVITVILFYYNDGRWRGFSIIAVILGFLLYRCSLGKLFGRFSARVSAAVGAWIYRACCYMARPIVGFFAWVFKMILRPIRFFKHKISERRIRKYDTMRTEQLRKISKKGFVNI